RAIANPYRLRYLFVGKFGEYVSLEANARIVLWGAFDNTNIAKPRIACRPLPLIRFRDRFRTVVCLPSAGAGGRVEFNRDKPRPLPCALAVAPGKRGLPLNFMVASPARPYIIRRKVCRVKLHPRN